MASCAHAAPLVVAESRGVAWRIGKQIDGNQRIHLVQGQHLTLVSESGDIVRLNGPYDGAPSASSGGGGSTFTAIQELFTGGPRLGDTGASRGNAPQSLPEPWLIDTDVAGRACLPEGAKAILWRSQAGRSVAVTLRPSDGSWFGKFDWPAGQNRLPLPEQWALVDEGTYIVSVGGVESAITVYRIPTTLTNDRMRAGWMYERGCEIQAAALWKSISTESGK